MTQASDVLMREKGDNPGIGHSLIDYFDEVVELVCHFINSETLEKNKPKFQINVIFLLLLLF